MHSFASNFFRAVISSLILLLCLSCRTGWGTGSVMSTSPGQMGLSMALWLEDRCESQEKDDRTITLLEAVHDGLFFPMQALVAVGVVTIAGTAWSISDRFTLPTGSLLPNRPEMVVAYLMPQRAGPAVRDTGPIQTVPVTWFGCLAYDDG